MRTTFITVGGSYEPRRTSATRLTLEGLRVRTLFAYVIANPMDWTAMAVLGDALEDAGSVDLAHAWRWAAANHKWPFQRIANQPRGFFTPFDWSRGSWKVYDWNVPLTYNDEGVHPGAQISTRLISAILRDRNRRYGGIHRAFVILARALKAVNYNTEEKLEE